MNSLVLPILFALSLPPGLDANDTVAMDDGVVFAGAECQREAAIGGPFALEVYFHAPEPLEPTARVFVHVEGEGARCRTVRDVTPERADDGTLTALVSLRMPDTCSPGDAHIRTGIYDARSGERLAVTGRATTDDRLHAGWIRVVEADPDTSSRVFTPSNVLARERLDRIRPWFGWLAGLLATSLLTFALARRARTTSRLEPIAASPRARKLGLAALMLSMFAGVLAAIDFVKDDAYISFRYAHNLAFGHGFVFNPGERLEGYTNFLWTLLMVPFERLGLDLFQVSEVLGTLMLAALLVVLVRLGERFAPEGPRLSSLWGPLWFGTGSGVVLWVTSGMEQPLAMLLPPLGLLLLWRARDDGSARRAALAGMVLGAGCITRPEIHLMAILAGVPLLVESLRLRRVPMTSLAWGAGVLAVTAPTHLFRYLYYGELLPNTFYVKTGGSVLVWQAGLDALRDMFTFNATGAVVLLVPFAFLDRRRLAEKLVCLAIAGGFMVHIAKVGVDEMHWHRLYLPALPFLALLGGIGLANLVSTIARIARSVRVGRVLALAAWAAVATGAIANFAFTYRSMGGFNGRGELSGTYHPDMGKFITRHERPGGLVAFQDMGSTPYHAPDIDFLDFIGLVDETVARARHDYGLHAFMATESHRNQERFDSEMRDYFRERSPEWTILTAYVPVEQSEEVSTAFASNPREDALERRRHNSYQFEIDRDPWFLENYVHVRTWPRSATYYLSLFRRKDLWEQTPGEVVLDAVPADVGGVSATFEGGLRLEGSAIEEEALEKHEAFFTTWWTLPGPMYPDLLFFIHVWNDGAQSPYDHVPGDWMYPAERWQAGQVLENRVLWQVPNGLRPGEYTVSMGAYRASTGERLPITSGPDDGQSRVTLGTIRVRPLLPPLHQLIPPTRVDEQRKYPERIVDHGRPRE